MAVLHSQQQLIVDTPEGDKTLAYQLWQPVAPEAKRLVVCVHGLTRNSRDFDFLARQLAADSLVVCPDIPGRGDSDWLSDGRHYGYPLYLQLMMQLLARLRQQFGLHHCDWVGTSMGGLIGMMLASQPQNPLPLRRLVLNDVGYFLPFAALSRISEYVGRAPQFASLAAVELYLRDVGRPFGPLADEHWQHLARHGSTVVQSEAGEYRQLKYDPAIARAFLELNGDVELDDIWQQVDIPVLLLRGAQSDLLLAETAALMAQKPGVRLVEFDAVGHAPMLMDAEQINVVAGFLRMAAESDFTVRDD